LALREHVPLVFVIGEKNRGLVESEHALRDAGLVSHELTVDSASFQSGDVIFVPNCGHGMHYDNPVEFWRVVEALRRMALVTLPPLQR